MRLNSPKIIYSLSVLSIIFLGAKSFNYADKLSYLSFITIGTLVFIALLTKDIRKRFGKHIIIFGAFGFWALAGSLWSQYPLVTVSRSLYFLFLTSGVVAIVLLSEKSNFTFQRLTIPFNVILVAVSLFSIMSGMPENAWTGGNAKGLMSFAGHQNTLAALLLFTSFGWIKNGFSTKGETKNRKLIYTALFFIVINLVLIIFTHSRAGLLSFVICIQLCLIFYFKKEWKKTLPASIILILLVIISIGIKEKIQGNKSGNPGASTVEYIFKGDSEVTSTRDFLYKDSYNAAIRGGIWGIGYGVSHPEIINQGAGSHYEGGQYIREKGNSILALIEETGLIGLILFFSPLGFALYKHRSKLSVPGLIVILAMTVHSQFEAWMVGLNIFLFVFLGLSLILDRGHRTEESDTQAVAMKTI